MIWDREPDSADTPPDWLTLYRRCERYGAGSRRAWGGQMTDTMEQISRLLHEAGETHHRVFRIVDGADDDWASWYADWLIKLSELPALLGVKPVRSELVYLLVSLDKEYTTTSPDQPWEDYYSARVLGHFNPSGH